MIGRNQVPRRWAPLVLLGAAACFAGAEPLAWNLEEAPAEAPRAEPDAWEKVASADALFEQGRDEEARQLVEGLLEGDPLFVAAARLRQNDLRARGRAGVAWREIEILKARYPDRPEPLYLEARSVPELRAKRRLIDAGLRRFPEAYWLRYAAAWCLMQSHDFADKKRADAILQGLARTQVPWTGVFWLLHRNTALQKYPSPHLGRMLELSRRFPSDGRLDYLIFRTGAEVVTRLLSALEKIPTSPELRELLSDRRLHEEHGRTLVRFLARRTDLADKLVESGGGLLLARLAAAHGESALAERCLERSCRGPRPSPAIDWRGRLRSALRERMQRLVRRGDLAAAIALWEERVPVDLFNRVDNRVNARLQAVLRGPGRMLRGRPESAEAAADVLRALLRAGWVEEAATLAARCLDWFPDRDRIVALRDEAERFLLFEEAIADYFGGPARDLAARGPLGEVLSRVRALSERVLGTDVVGQPRLLSFPIVGGRLVDPFGPGLPAFFDRYNRHLVLGTLGTGRAAVMIGVKVAETRLAPDAGLPLLGDCREVVVEEKRVSTAAEIGVSDPAGIALWNHYVLDVRAIRSWVAELDEIRRRVDEQGLAEVLGDPVATVGPLDLSRPGQVNWKLTALAVHENGWSREQVWEQVYRLLRVHERAHLVDAHRFLPVGVHLGPALWLFAAAGFSQHSLQANLEGRAECAALALGADPRLTLAHLSSFLSDAHTAGASVHQVGFKRVLRRILELWAADGAPGAREPTKNLLAQLHMMAAERAVEYGEAVLAEYGFAGR